MCKICLNKTYNLTKRYGKQITSIKYQITKKQQDQAPNWLLFEVWVLEFIWKLKFGIGDLFEIWDLQFEI